MVIEATKIIGYCAVTLGAGYFMRWAVNNCLREGSRTRANQHIEASVKINERPPIVVTLVSFESVYGGDLDHLEKTFAGFSDIKEVLSNKREEIFHPDEMKFMKDDDLRGSIPEKIQLLHQMYSPLANGKKDSQPDFFEFRQRFERVLNEVYKKLGQIAWKVKMCIPEGLSHKEEHVKWLHQVDKNARNVINNFEKIVNECLDTDAKKNSFIKECYAMREIIATIICQEGLELKDVSQKIERQ